MLPYYENHTEAAAVLAVLPPQSAAAGVVTVGPFTSVNAMRTLFMINIGALGGAGTVNAKVQASATSGGAYTDVAGTAITAVSAGASNLVFIEVRAETLAAAGQGPYLKLVVTIGVNAVLVSAVALSMATHYAPGAGYSIVAPAQILNV